MQYWKVRLFALIAIAIFIGLIYVNWQQLISESRYSMQMAAFAPVGVVFGIFLLFFPRKIGRPETMMDKIIVLFVFGIGLAAGLYNLYLMDPLMFNDVATLFSQVL